MEIPFKINQYLEEKIAEIACDLENFDTSFNPDVRTADPQFGDFQINGILPYAKQIKKNPRELASTLINALTEKKVFDPELMTFNIAGPGFINFKLSPKFLFEWLKRYKDENSFRLAAGSFYQGKKISIDYSSPNTAKQMHVGHIRSMFLGEAIQRLLTFCGAKVIRDNHIGDWGTQFGILIIAIQETNYNLDALHHDVLEDLETLYRKGRELFDSSDLWKERARQELVKLQEGDPASLAIWEKINTVSYKAFQEIYDLLNIKFDVVQGESFYRNQVDFIYKELTETGIAKEDDGALVVFYKTNSGHYPFIIRKKDGASNYASTDLATIYYHTYENHVDKMLYVVGSPQQDHFKYLFATATQWFNARKYNLPEFHHIWFGSILGEDGKAIKTRSGTPIKLKELLFEAIERARKIVEEKNPDLSEQEKAYVAKVVGLGAVRYADLVQNRTTDYVFSWDKILAFEGNTAPYLLYAVARIHSIFRKANIDAKAEEVKATVFETSEEISLAQKLIEFPIVLEQAIKDFYPHTISNFIYELAGKFSSFYNANKVIVDDLAVRARRLLLCSRTLQLLQTGLHLLGLETLEKM